MNSPRYSYPPGVLARVVRDVLLLRPRDFHEDAKACIETVDPPLKVWGRENIPQHGTCVVTINHYHRPGFGAQWLALAVSALVPAPIHWIMTGEFMDWGKWGSGLSRMFLRRIAAIYGFTTMPPMPPRSQDVEARARSVGAVLKYVQRTKDPILGLAPEGYDVPHGALTRPATGLGRFGLLLSQAGLAFVPVGAYEATGFFHLRFGERYQLRVSDNVSGPEKDACAIQIVMKHIAELLPVHLRGEFA